MFKRILIVGFLFLLPFSVLSQSGGVAGKFAAYDENSTARINHGPLTAYLDATVFPVGRSYRILGDEKPEAYRGSHIKTSKSLSPSRFEGSRIMIHAFTEGHKEFFRAYQVGLERLSSRRSLSAFNKNEQAAFWLNLYNVIVINKLIEEYPISNLKSLRSTKRGKTSFWDEKVTTIEGAPLSLTDIEDILFTNFDTPLVAFGLWQGSIGGPRLLNYAYTGNNVWRSLERNAVEFVNSNRGLRPPTGTRMSVSDYYEWTMPAFGTTQDHVLSFIKEYADPNFISGVDNVTTLSFKIYDWTIADLLGGSKHSGQDTQLGGVLTAGSSQPQGLAAAASEGGPPPVSLTRLIGSYQDSQPTGGVGLPDVAVELFQGIQLNTRTFNPVITTEECGPDEVCKVENVDWYNDDDGGQ